MSTPERKVPASASLSPFTALANCDEKACARDRIFSAAINLFYRNGIRGVSVDAIAEEAGTTKVTFYRVFESKDDLIVQVLEEQSKRYWEWWDAIVAEFPGQPRKQLEVLIERFQSDIIGDEECRGCAVANAAVEIVDENHPARIVIKKHKLAIAERLRAMCREMGARQPDVLGDALALLVSGAFSSRLAFDTREQVSSVSLAAAALLDSPAIGAPTK